VPTLSPDQIADAFLAALEYDLYPVQEEALLAWFERDDDGVLVCAPTGTGKTLIAEAAVFEALHLRRRLYYTTPLIALTEQKYRELKARAVAWGFAESDVGFITGNRRENPDALIRVVVAEILLNHLLSGQADADSDAAFANGRDGARPLQEDVRGGTRPLQEDGRGGTRPLQEDGRAGARPLHAVVMDEFHSFNDPERGVVWELALVMLPKTARVMLLSATVGNPVEFALWLREKHGRRVRVVQSTQRKVPLEYHWVGDTLLTHLLPGLSEGDDQTRRTPALVFCFNRDECWEVAETLKGLKLASDEARKQIEAILNERHVDDLADGVGPKLRQMLIRGVGVHHAGVLPKHKLIVEELFNAKLVPFVVCTETLAAGVNLPARSVVLSSLMKGPPIKRELIASSSAHQIFGRAGRPQFDTQGHVYAVAHEDDARIEQWKKKYEALGTSKDPNILRMRKELERKKPTRRKNETYWVEGQFKSLIAAGPARLASRGMIPYSVLIFLLTRQGRLADVRDFVSKRFAPPGGIENFQKQLDAMLGNLEALGYLKRAEDGDHVALNESIYRLLDYRSVDPLYGEFLRDLLTRSDQQEKIAALESVLEVPPKIARRSGLPPREPGGPLEETLLKPMLISMGVQVSVPEPDPDAEDEYWEEEPPRPPTFPEMLKLAFDARLAAPEDVIVQPKWIAGAAFEFGGEFFKYVKSADLVKQEGLILRHLLRLALLAGEFFARSEDPEYQAISEQATRTCQRVDASYTARFLEEAEAARKLLTR
jgi:superfamily II DNA/RNA helicase